MILHKILVIKDKSISSIDINQDESEKGQILISLLALFSNKPLQPTFEIHKANDNIVNKLMSVITWWWKVTTAIENRNRDTFREEVLQVLAWRNSSGRRNKLLLVTVYSIRSRPWSDVKSSDGKRMKFTCSVSILVRGLWFHISDWHDNEEC